MLYLIGLGLSEDDISMKGLEKLKESDIVYCELYTNNWMGDLKKLEKIIDNSIVVLSREETENGDIIDHAEKKTVSLLIPGDPLSATTHFQLYQEAKERKVTCNIIHAPSIYTAVAETGLQLYKFGRATTLAYPEEKFFPTSPYDVIELNQKAGLHTLVLLDIKKDRQMTINEGLDLLFQLEGQQDRKVINENMKIVACTRLGNEDKKILYGPFDEIKKLELKGIPASIIIPGDLNFKEEEALEMWMI